MRLALVRLAVLLGVLAVISRFEGLRAQMGTPVVLAAGGLLLCGLFAGKLAKRIGLPRLTGYLLIGVVIGPYLLRFIPKEGVAGLDLIKGLAVSLIALTAGTELRLGRLQKVGRKVVVLCGTITAFVFGSTLGTLLLLKPLLPFLRDLSWPQALAVAALTSAVIVSFSPTVTVAIVQETKARGSFTEFLMALVIVADLMVFVLFALAAGATKATLGAQVNVGQLLGGIGWELFGSIAIGGVLGVLALLYLKHVRREVPLFLSALCFGAAELGVHLHLSSLLVSLAAGALIVNLDETEGVKIHHALEQVALPVFALFFAAAGAGLNLSVLGVVGPLALVLVAVRGVSIYFSARRFAPREDERLPKYLWMGLISQAGVTLGLASLLGRTFPTFGPAVEVLIIAMITVHELIGPVLTRRALTASGEVPTDREAEAA
jgi:Kef-type K+ transport system membrane component KefB